jgi:5-methylthioribose kinase
MSLRSAAMTAHPDFPWLDVEDMEAVRAYLETRGHLADGEEFRSSTPAGDGNMNLTLRVRTNRRSFVLKQARPWVEKYDHIAAPWDRTLFEQRFYQRAAKIPTLRERMPRVLAADPQARITIFEDLPDARDLTTLYSGDALDPAEVAALADYLGHLHAEEADAVDLANRAMRALNHEHMFVIPLADQNGLPLEGFERGLEEAAALLKRDQRYREAVRATGERYLADGTHLLHGDYFPGSWLRTKDGLRIIDPEFCFCGDPEFDLGVALAHLVLARQDPALWQLWLEAYGRVPGAPRPRKDWLARYAGVELMRRTIGVAQLPVPPSPATGPEARRRAQLLSRSRAALLEQRPEALWG